MNIRNLLKNGSVRNAGWLIGGQVMDKILSFLIGILTARYLGPENYGLLHYGTAFTVFFANLCRLGLQSVIIKNFADHPQEEGEAIGTALVLRAVCSVLSAVTIVGFVAIMDREDPLTVLVVALSSMELLFMSLDSFKQWFQSRLQSKFVAIAMVASYLAVSAYRVVLMLTGRGVAWFALSNSVHYLVVAVWLMIAYKKRGGQRLRFSRKKAKQLLTASSSFIISGVMVSICASTDKLMLKQMLDETAVGYYSLAFQLTVTWAFVLQAIIDSVHPAIIQSHGKDPAGYLRKNKQLYAIVFYVAAVACIVISLLAKPLITILYGQAYLGSVTPLRIVVWYTAFAYLGSARDAWIICENQQKYLKHLYISAAAINVVLNLALIPMWGPSGAAWASLITQASTVVVLPLLIKALRPNARMMLDAVLLRGVMPPKNEE